MLVISPKHAHPSQHDMAGTFPGLMDLYERNYIGLRRMLPEIPEQGAGIVSRLTVGLDLHLTVLERFPYTSELGLTYYFNRDGLLVPEPNLRIRVYHDARQAEVMAATLRHGKPFNERQEASGSALQERWRVNRFLYKWLNYCSLQGHRFSSVVMSENGE